MSLACACAECPVKLLFEALPLIPQEYVIMCGPAAFPNARTCGKLKGWVIDKNGNAREIPERKLLGGAEEAA